MTLGQARVLEANGADGEAQRAWLERLQADPYDLAALNGLGRLLHRTGFPTAARTAFEQAVYAHPASAAARVNLATVLFDAGESDVACAHYEAALLAEPSNAHAHQGLAIAALRAGDLAGARRHACDGYGHRPLRWPYRGAGTPPEVLVLFSGIGGNVPVERFIDERLFQKSTLVAEFCDAQTDLAEHDVVFNAIGDADRCGAALDVAAALVARTRAPIINDPARVRLTDRVTNARRLRAIEHVVTPLVVRLERQRLLAPDAEATLTAAGFEWPLLIRAPGFHTGEHFVRVDKPAELAAAVAALPGDELLAMQLVDARGVDGACRKYRAMFVDGALYPLHLAVSTHWKVHYFTADLMDQPGPLAEQEAFLGDMPRAIGPHATRALGDIAHTLGLDYGGIDFGLDSEGNVLFFEANATMILPSADRSSSRQEAIARVREATQAMIRLRAKGKTP